jgi:hypothetical protein
MDFTYHNYERLLNHIKDLGYIIGTFRDFQETGPYVVLRHDVDYSLLKARDMAKLDHSLGISATYLVLLTSPYYNAITSENIQLIKEITELGNEIGLHYDCRGFQGLSVNERITRIQRLISVLESHTGLKVQTVGEHKAAEANIELHLQGYIDVFDPKFVRDIAYVRDSAMIINIPNPFEFFRQNSRVQLLVHPIWWHSEGKTLIQVFDYMKSLINSNAEQTLKSDEQSIAAWHERQKYKYVPWERPQYQYDE